MQFLFWCKRLKWKLKGCCLTESGIHAALEQALDFNRESDGEADEGMLMLPLRES